MKRLQVMPLRGTGRIERKQICFYSIKTVIAMPIAFIINRPQVKGTD
jgi:hypothetical protein